MLCWYLLRFTYLVSMVELSFMSSGELAKSPIGILICTALQIFAAFVDIILLTEPFWVADLFNILV